MKPQGPVQASLLHNMSVPSTSRITVARAMLPGLRFRIDLPEPPGRRAGTTRDRLAKGGWQAAWRLLEAANDTPGRARGAKRQLELLERHLEEAKERAGVPDRLGVFVHEDPVLEIGSLLSPAAALAVLARRSGPLYLPSRRLELSLVDPQPLVLFVPEEPR